MKYIADLHTHSSYSRATSKAANLEGYYQWAKVKGIHLIGTGDFTHPGWLKELKSKLVPDGGGFFVLKDPPKNLPDEIPPLEKGLEEIDIRFCLSAELSTIYKKNDKTRKVHSVIFAPDFDVVEKIISKLITLGKNLASDGRPILGLDTKDLLEIVLEASDNAYLVPAHIWTPWFSLFGSNSGFDRIEDCFEDLTSHIFALETGLSSDPEMNWRLSVLDRYHLISNSDAHSPKKLGREANIFNTGFTYHDMFQALKTGKGYCGTIEFYPEEGKYHLDGHRKCGICFEPEETRNHKGICPKCGKKLTVGVMHRILELADREKGEKPGNHAGFQYLIPLPEVISEITGTGAGTKGVYDIYSTILSTYGNEFTFLLDAPVSEIEETTGAVFGEAVKRMRNGKINPKPGFDGEYGIIRVFHDGELEQYHGQQDLFDFKLIKKKRRSADRENLLKKDSKKKPEKEEKALKESLNPAQQRVLAVTSGSLLITAGPGTGKTRTLTAWITHLISKHHVKPGEILAITFTNRAADEMKERLHRSLPGPDGENITICTFHSFCFELVRERFPSITSVFDEKKRSRYLRFLFPEMTDKEMKGLVKNLKQSLEQTGNVIPEKYHAHGQKYLNALKRIGGVDLSALVAGMNQLLKKESETLSKLRNRYRYIAIDELQDINQAQYTLITNLFPFPSEKTDDDRCLLAIGDPDQAIYGFRGSDISLFYKFRTDYTPVEITLETNYRSTEQILKAGEAVIAHNKVKKMISLTSYRGNGEKISYFPAADPVKEGKYIASKIEQLVGGMSFTASDLSYEPGENLYSFSDIAILARTRALFNDLIPFLSGAGIPLSIHHAAPLMEEPPFSSVSGFLSLLAHVQDIVALHDILTHLYDSFSPGELSRILPLLHDHLDEPFPVLQEFLNNRKITGKQYEDALEVFSLLQLLPVTLEQEGVKGVLKKLFERYIPGENEYDEISLKKEALCDAAQRFGSDLSGYLKMSFLNPNESESLLNTDKVHLLTFHAAKGCEFPVVFIAGAEEGITPLLSKNTDIEEERRLFYVAITRAKDRVIISSSLKRRFFGKWKETGPSRFTGEIPEQLFVKQTDTVIKKESEQYGQPLLF
ncbi:MAG: UvrD-helicase domain-containing protein [Spirochaetales bacterium]|nr:UvrD-helicase domain-containing protein [Spirochaetales bacterium]